VTRDVAMANDNGLTKAQPAAARSAS